MGLITAIKNARKQRVKNKATVAREFILGDDGFLIDSTNNELKLSAVFSAITTITSTMSKIPFFIFDKNTKKRIDDENIYNLLNIAPNGIMNASTMNALIMLWELCDGEAFVLPVKGYRSNKIVKRIPFRQSQVSKYIDKTNYEVYYDMTFADGHIERHNANEVEHYMFITQDGITGLSPLDYARETINAGLNQDEYNKNVFKGGARPIEYIKLDGELGYGQTKVVVGFNEDGTPKTENMSVRDAVRYEWIKAKANGTGVLDRGMSYQTVTPISPEQMQFVTSKDITVQDIARFFRMGSCMFKLGVGKQSYSTNEQGQICYINETIAPLLRQIEQELTLKLLTEEQRAKGWQIKGNLNAELRGDTAARLAWYKGMKEMGVYSINEVRDYEDLSGIGKDGDVRTIGPNAVPLERAISGESAADITPNNVNAEAIIRFINAYEEFKSYGLQ